MWSSAPELCAMSSPADLPCLPQACLPMAPGLPVLLDPFGFSLVLLVPCLVFSAAFSAMDPLDQDTSGWSRCLCMPASSDTERPDVAFLHVAQHHLAQRGQHALAVTLEGLVVTLPWL